MILLQIPENTNELRDHKIFINAVQEFNKFQNNVQSYLKQIVKDEFLKDVNDWKNIIKEEDFKKLKNIETKSCFYCYKTNKFISNYYGRQSEINNRWMMGLETKNIVSYEMSTDGTNFLVINTWKYQKARFSHNEFNIKKQIYKISLLDKSVKCIENSWEQFL